MEKTSIKDWLVSLRLGEYEGRFHSKGYTFVEQCLYVEKDLFDEVGILNEDHCESMKLNLSFLKKIKPKPIEDETIIKSNVSIDDNCFPKTELFCDRSNKQIDFNFNKKLSTYESSPTLSQCLNPTSSPFDRHLNGNTSNSINKSIYCNTNTVVQNTSTKKCQSEQPILKGPVPTPRLNKIQNSYAENNNIQKPSIKARLLNQSIRINGTVDNQNNSYLRTNNDINLENNKVINELEFRLSDKLDGFDIIHDYTNIPVKKIESDKETKLNVYEDMLLENNSTNLLTNDNSGIAGNTTSDLLTDFFTSYKIPKDEIVDSRTNSFIDETNFIKNNNTNDDTSSVNDFIYFTNNGNNNGINKGSKATANSKTPPQLPKTVSNILQASPLIPISTQPPFLATLSSSQGKVFTEQNHSSKNSSCFSDLDYAYFENLSNDHMPLKVTSPCLQVEENVLKDDKHYDEESSLNVGYSSEIELYNILGAGRDDCMNEDLNKSKHLIPTNDNIFNMENITDNSIYITEDLKSPKSNIFNSIPNESWMEKEEKVRYSKKWHDVTEENVFKIAHKTEDQPVPCDFELNDGNSHTYHFPSPHSASQDIKSCYINMGSSGKLSDANYLNEVLCKSKESLKVGSNDNINDTSGHDGCDNRRENRESSGYEDMIDEWKEIKECDYVTSDNYILEYLTNKEKKDTICNGNDNNSNIEENNITENPTKYDVYENREKPEYVNSTFLNCGNRINEMSSDVVGNNAEIPEAITASSKTLQMLPPTPPTRPPSKRISRKELPSTYASTASTVSVSSSYPDMGFNTQRDISSSTKKSKRQSLKPMSKITRINEMDDSTLPTNQIEGFLMRMDPSAKPAQKCWYEFNGVSLTSTSNEKKKDVIPIHRIIGLISKSKNTSEFEFELCLKSPEQKVRFACDQDDLKDNWVTYIARSIACVCMVDLMRINCFSKAGNVHVSTHTMDAFNLMWAHLHEKVIFLYTQDEEFEENDLRKMKSIKKVTGEEKDHVFIIEINFADSHLKIKSETVSDAESWFESLSEASQMKSPLLLEEHRLNANNVPVAIEKCIKYINKYGLDTEGIYRLSGQVSKITTLLESLNEDAHKAVIRSDDIHEVSNCLKRFLRQLDEPLFPRKSYTEWIDSFYLHKSREDRIQRYKKTFASMPVINYESIKYIVCHLAKVIRWKELNKMDSINIASIFGPLLLTAEKSGFNTSYNNTNQQIEIIKDIIENYAEIFDQNVMDEEMQHKNMKEAMQKLNLLTSNQAVSEAFNLRSKGLLVSVVFDNGEKLRSSTIYSFNVGENSTVAELEEKMWGKVGKNDHFYFFEVVCDGELERMMHPEEKVMTVVMRYQTWPKDFTTAATLVYKTTDIFKNIHLYNQEKNFSLFSELKFTQRKSFKKYFFEFTKYNLSYRKDYKASVIISSWPVENLDIFLGVQQKRSPPSPYGISFFDRKQSPNMNGFFGNSLCFDNETDYYKWIALLLHAQHPGGYQYCKSHVIDSHDEGGKSPSTSAFSTFYLSSQPPIPNNNNNNSSPSTSDNAGASSSNVRVNMQAGTLSNNRNNNKNNHSNENTPKAEKKLFGKFLKRSKK